MIRALLAILLLGGFTANTQNALRETGGIKLIFRPGDYKLLKDGATAKAVIAANGEKFIIVSMDADMDDLGPRILHEMGHHLTWDRHGIHVEEHGPEFRKICRELITEKRSIYCKGH